MTSQNTRLNGSNGPTPSLFHDFSTSGLLADSVIRLGFLAVLPRKSILGSIGAISPQRHRRLLHRLSAYLVEKVR